MSRISWDDVKHFCFPGSTVDVPCMFKRGSSANCSYVSCEFTNEYGERSLRLINGFELWVEEYEAPLGFCPPI